MSLKRKNQQLKGVGGSPKLDEAQVMKIRDLLLEGKLAYRQIAEMFGISEGAVRLINNGETWSHVEGIGTRLRPTKKIRTRQGRSSGNKLNEAQVVKIRDLLIEGRLRYRQIAEMFGVSYANIRAIADGKTWTHLEGLGSNLKLTKNKKTCIANFLNESQVVKIRNLLIEGKLTFNKISEEFGVSLYILRLINNGKAWTQAEGIGARLRPPKKLRNAKLSEDQVIEIKNLLIEDDFTYEQIAYMFGVSRQTIQLINRGKIWTHVEGIGSKIRTKNQ